MRYLFPIYLILLIFSQEQILGQTTFGPQNVIATYDFIKLIESNDLDGDGDQDIIVGTFSGAIEWYPNDGAGNFLDPMPIPITPSANTPISIKSVDLNSDGHPDILTNIEGKSIAWYENDQAGNFGVPTVIATETGTVRHIIPVDIDNDQDFDILVVKRDETNYNAAWYSNDGLGSFDGPNIIPTELEGVYSMDMIDIDNDGDLDIVGLHGPYNDCKLMWNENDGSNNFLTPVLIDETTSGLVYTLDIDLDGDDDILMSNYTDDFIAWYENQGNGDFSEPIQITDNVNGPTDLIMTDLDGDAIDDLISISGFDNKVAWYKTDGTGIFSDQIIIDTTTTTGPASMVVTDIDNDGDLDVVVASIGDGKVSWYENLYEPEIIDNINLLEVDFTFDIISSNEKIIINLATDQFTEYYYNIFDINGRSIHSGQIHSNSTTIHIPMLSSGMYIVQLNNGNHQITSRILID